MISSKDKHFITDYLLDYLDGCFIHSKYTTDKFIRLCREEYKNEEITCYRAIRQMSDQTNKYKITSSHKQLISSSISPYSALYACYDFGKSLDEEFDQVVVLEVKQTPLLTFDQILELVKSRPLRHTSIYKRTLKEQEVLLVYKRSEFTYKLYNVYNMPAAQHLVEMADSVFDEVI